MQFEFGFAEGIQRSGVPAKAAAAPRHRSASDLHPILPGLGYRRIHNLFFAAQLDGEAAAQAFAIPSHIGLDLPRRSIVPLENLHITFHSVAQQEGIPKGLVTKASGAISVVSATSFDVTFDRLENFAHEQSRYALVVLCRNGLERLTALHSQIGEALKQAGFRHIGKSFVPHVTLAYNTTPFAIPPVAPISWRLDRFALIESPRGERKHKVQGSWLLV